MMRMSIEITTSDQIGSTGIVKSQNTALKVAKTSATPALHGFRVNSRKAAVNAISAQMIEIQPQVCRPLEISPSLGRYFLSSRAPMPQSRLDAPARVNMTAAKVNQPAPAGRCGRAVAMVSSDHRANTV